jgi:replicative DNA helicase
MTVNLHEDRYTFFIYLSHFFVEWEMLQTKVVEEIKPHFMFNKFFFFENRAVYENVEKCGRAGQATDDNMVHCMLDNEGLQTHTHHM